MNLWFLTEEKPKKSVVVEILKLYCKKYNENMEIDFTNYKIYPIFINKTFSFKYEIIGIKISNINRIFLKTVSGSSSFLDYLLIKQQEMPSEGSLENIVMAIEETKTSDDESRNTGVYQRASKFVFIKQYCQNVDSYMLYNDELQSRENKKPSDTSIFGTNLLLTLGVNIIGKSNMSWFKKYNSIDEIISAKNNMRKPPAGNVPILINKYSDRIEISGRLVKNGTLSHDPNIGALSLISMAFRHLGWDKRIVITKHGLSQKYISNTRGKNKFLYICKLFNIELEGININFAKTLPESYWHYEMSSEKVTSILLHILAENNGMLEVYQNHAGCERGYFKTKEGQLITLPKKDASGKENLYIPDLILYNDDRNCIILIEAKKLSTLSIGLEEIKHYDSIENEYIHKYYPGSTDLRYLTLFGGNETELSDKNVLVQMNFDGSIIINPDAPDFIKDLFDN
jgi:hypothetical protein